MAARLSKLKPHVDDQVRDKKGKVRPHAVSGFLKDIAKKANVSYATTKKAYDGHEIRDTSARAIQSALPDVPLSAVWEKPKAESVDMTSLKGRSLLSPPVIPLAEAKKRFKEKSHRVESPYCAGCFNALTENKVPGLPFGRAQCRLMHGYVMYQGSVTWPEDIPPENQPDVTPTGRVPTHPELQNIPMKKAPKKVQRK